MFNNNRPKKYDFTGDLLILLIGLMFFFLNKNFGVLNYILFLLTLFLLTPINKYLKKYLTFNSNDLKVLFVGPILLVINFLLFFHIDNEKKYVEKLKQRINEKNQVICNLSNITQSNPDLK
jgi:hypothetical protein